MINGAELAQRFHETYERLSPSFGYETRPDTKAFVADSPNGKLMMAVCQEIGDALDREAYDRGFAAGWSEGSGAGNS